MPEVSDADFTQLFAYRAVAPTPEKAREKIEGLEVDNKKQRDEIRVLKEKTPEGAVVLVGDDAKAWPLVQKVLAAGVKPEEIETGLAERTTLQKTLAEREEEDGRRDAAAAMKWNPKVLSSLKQADGLLFSIQEETVTEKGQAVKVPVAFVTEKGKEGAKPVKLADYAEQNWPAEVRTALATAEAAGSTRATVKTVISTGSENGTPADGTATQSEIADGKRKKYSL